MHRPLLIALALSCLLSAACGGDTIDALSQDSPDADLDAHADLGADLPQDDAATPDMGSEPDLHTGEDPDMGEDPDTGQADLDQPDTTAPDLEDPDTGEPDLDMGEDPDMGDDPDMGEDPDMGAEEAMHPALYPSERTLSPITPSVAAHLRQIAARDPSWNDHVFAKVGASTTVSQSFLHCFATELVDLDGRVELQAAIDHFEAGYADGTTPFDRESLTATVGWSAVSALAGDPSPLEQELAAIEPRFAVIMYGTNDIERRNIDQYAGNLLDMADLLMERGIIPIFSTIMPRDDNAASDALVPDYNAVVRAVAQGRQIPMMDFHRELLPLPDHGLSGDNLHPSTYRPGGARACYLTPEGLQYGYNIRNLITLQSLDRVRRVLIEDEAAPDAPGPALEGQGSLEDPFVIDRLPFVDLRDTTQSPSRALDSYSGCDAGQDESGPEWIYRLDLDRPATLRARVFDRGQVDIDLHLLRGQPSEEACFVRAHQEIEAELEPGTWYLALDTWVNSGGQALGGEYMLTVLLEE